MLKTMWLSTRLCITTKRQSSDEGIPHIIHFKNDSNPPKKWGNVDCVWITYEIGDS